MLKKIFLGLKKPVFDFRSKKSKNQELGLKKVVDVNRVKKNYRNESLFKYMRKKNEFDQKKGQQKNLREN